MNSKYKYFYKTEEELIKNGGESWFVGFSQFITYHIVGNKLFGKEFKNENSDDDNMVQIKINDGDTKYFVSSNLYNKVLNDDIKEEYDYTVKTEREFVDEFGATWKNNTIYTWTNNMSFLFGLTLIEYKIDENGIISVKSSLGETYFLSPDMYKKKPKDKNIIKMYQYFIKTKSDFISEFGEDWKLKLSRRWDPTMDRIFGEKIKGVYKEDDCHQFYFNGRIYFLSNDMIKKEECVPLTIENVENTYSKLTTKLNTKVELSIKSNNKIFDVYYWLEGEYNKEAVKNYFNSHKIKYTIIGIYGDDYKIDIKDVLYTISKGRSETFNKFYTIQTIINPIINPIIESKNDINLDILSDKELDNLKDRIDEIIFKRKYNFNDEEYEFYLENEEEIKPENVKSFLIEFKNDKFKLRKNKIRIKLQKMEVL